MKGLFVLILFLIISTTSHAQTKYTVNKIAYATVSTNSNLNVGTFSPVANKFIILLYNDALVFEDSASNYYKFARKIDMGDRQRWNALDRNGNACEITIKDYGTYTLIAIKYMDSNKVTIYQTL